jgi:hypothetical protein
MPLTMGHYTREDLPFYYVLSDAFTVCDQSSCGVMTSTTPNRSTFWTGTVRGSILWTATSLWWRSRRLGSMFICVVPGVMAW